MNMAMDMRDSVCFVKVLHPTACFCFRICIFICICILYFVFKLQAKQEDEEQSFEVIVNPDREPSTIADSIFQLLSK